MLPADFVSTVNADLKVGALEETVTVSGESPIVDVQTTKQQRTLDNELLRSIPTRARLRGGHAADAVDGRFRRRQFQRPVGPRA